MMVVGGWGVYQVAAIVQSDTLCWNRFRWGGSTGTLAPLDELILKRTEKFSMLPLKFCSCSKACQPPCPIGWWGVPDQHFCRLEISNCGPERHLKLLLLFFFFKKSFLSVGDLFSAEQFQLWLWERIGEDMCNVCERMSC